MKTVLVLEDHAEVRENLCGALADRKFRTLGAGSVEEARTRLAEVDYEVDVLVLDVVLNRDRMTGAQFGMEVKDRMRDHPPEFLIHTAYDKAEFVRQAMRLGAAEYLEKPAASLSDLTRMVRVLALRRSLALTKELTARLDRIAERSHDDLDALLRFSNDVLLAEMEDSLGLEVALLASSQEQTRLVSRERSLSGTSPAYDKLRRLVLAAPRELPAVDLWSQRDQIGEADAVERSALWELGEMSMVLLGRTDDQSLCVGLRRDESASGLSEDPAKLALVIREFLPPVILRPLMHLTKAFTAIYTRQRTLLESAANFCLYVGQEQTRIFDRALRGGTVAYEDLHPDIRRLISFSEHLRSAGELLLWASDTERLGLHGRELTTVSVRQVVDEAWEDVQEELGARSTLNISIEGDPKVVGTFSNLQIAVSRILHWLTLRAMEKLSDDEPQHLDCVIRADGRDVVVSFSDRSRRLPRELREKLLIPFASPVLSDLEGSRSASKGLELYLSRVLIEIGAGGTFSDRSDELEGGLGHCWVLTLPASPESSAAV